LITHNFTANGDGWKNHLRRAIAEHQDWIKTSFLHPYRNTPHVTTVIPPIELIFNRPNWRQLVDLKQNSTCKTSSLWIAQGNRSSMLTTEITQLITTSKLMAVWCHSMYFEKRAKHSEW